MPERKRGLGAVLVASAILLAGASGWQGGSAAALAWLAQVPAALGVAHLRGTRLAKPAPSGAGATWPWGRTWKP